MKLDLNDRLLGNTPDLVFESLWPSDATDYDGKVKRLLDSAFGKESILQDVARTNWTALQMVLMHKATAIGDLLTEQLRAASNFRVVKGAEELFGVFRRIDWSTFQTDPEQAIRIMVEAGIQAGLNALTAVPLVGQLANVFWSFGYRLVDMFEAARGTRPPVLMPWKEGRDTDEDLTRLGVLGIYSKKVDQTNLFRPPWTVSAAWHLGTAGSENGFTRIVWAPWENSAIPWNDGIGLLPGTMRIFGQVQLQGQSEAGGAYPGLPSELSNLKRITAAGAEIPWPPRVINTGSYYPSAASTCGTMWNMAERPGSPDMYKIHVQTLLDEWRLAFESMEQSFLDLWEPDQPNLLLGTAQIPWIAYRMRPQDGWSLGPPWRVPSFASWVRPGLYQGELPGAPGFVTDSLWIEEDLRPKTSRGTRIGRESARWPYGREPEQHPCSRKGACSSTLGATATSTGVHHPAAWKSVDGPAPKGYRKMPWPTPEMRVAQYASPWTAIVKPTLERLAAQQVACLKATVVCAYVRYEELPGGLAPYGAFKDGELRQLCKDMREQLLKHPIRFRVNLADAEAIDPQFAQRLRESGLTGTPADWAKSLGLAGGPVDGAPPPPPGQPPQGGIPFERTPNGRPRSGGGGGLILGLLGAAGLVGGGVALARHHNRQKGRHRG